MLQIVNRGPKKEGYATKYETMTVFEAYDETVVTGYVCKRFGTEKTPVAFLLKVSYK